MDAGEIVTVTPRVAPSDEATTLLAAGSLMVLSRSSDVSVGLGMISKVTTPVVVSASM